MKAVLQTKYGPPEVLELIDVEKPNPKDDEVLIKVQAASANPLDLSKQGGAARLYAGLLKPRDPRLGRDLAGQVEAIGNGVTQFQPGDEVFGGGMGTFAEYATARENELALKPANCTFEEAAAVPVVAMTALQGLRDKGHIQPGQKVLVNGASGGVGTFAVQIARSFGAEVTGVCSTRNLDLLRSIGAEQVIDYTKEDFTKSGQRYDLIFDAIGNHSVSDYKRALGPHGTCVIAGFSGFARLFEHIVLGPLRSRSGGQKVGFMGIANINHGDLVFVKELLEAGKVVPVIDRRYPLSETAQALRYLAEKHARGKLIITPV
ncbi:MAG: alcohol dehydrogenase [Chloroflexi bacterium]|nr:alcohol dehydrogenase [Chloroflexota bacterium]